MSSGTRLRMISLNKSSPSSILLSHSAVWSGLRGSGADRIVGAIRLGVRPGDGNYAAMT